MKQKNIEQELRDWFSLMLKKYAWLSIKFGFSEEEECYLVSFSPKSMSLQNEDFCRDALAFENKVNEKYGDFAPLFCDDEDLFELSPNAEVLSSHDEEMSFMEIKDEDSVKLAHFDFTSLFAQITPQFINEESFEDTRYKKNYNKAA
jgi:hypothetical protein